MKCRYLILSASLGFAAFLLGPSPALAQSAPTLGSAASFGVLGASTVTCTKAGAVDGDVGVWSGTAITGFNPDCTLTGTLHRGDDVARRAQEDAGLAYFALSVPACNVIYADGYQLGGKTLMPGVHCFPSSALLNGTLSLQGAGPWILRIGSTLTTGGTPAAPASVLVNGQDNCDAKDVFWQIGSSATIGVNTQFVGNILAVASITLVSGASLEGRALALGGAVTMDGNAVSVCGSGGSIPLPAGCRVKVICPDHHDKDCDDHHGKDCDHHDKDCDHHDKDGDHHDKDGDHCDKDGDGHHDKDNDKGKDGGKAKEGGKKSPHGR